MSWFSKTRDRVALRVIFTCIEYLPTPGLRLEILQSVQTGAAVLAAARVADVIETEIGRQLREDT